MAERDAGKQEAPEQRNRDAEDGGQDAVAPVLGYGESRIAELPHPIQAVCTIGLGNDVLKLHLKGNLKEAFIGASMGARGSYPPNPQGHKLLLSVCVKRQFMQRTMHFIELKIKAPG